jgi:hypothetical protein
MAEQLDLFTASRALVSAKTLREEERFGRLDFITGLPLGNHYSSRINGERLIAYERGYRDAR